MRILRLLTTLLAISLFPLLASAYGVKKVTVSVDRNYYKIFIKLSKPTPVRVVKDPKRDLIALSLKNYTYFTKSYYSVVIKGTRHLITVKVKNPRLDASRAVVRRNGDDLSVFIPFRKKFEKLVVVIDPGHGGHDTGAIYYGFREKWINLAVAKKLYYLLERDGRFKPLLTRSGDYYVSLSWRQRFAARAGADLFVSIHANAAPRNPKASGVEFYVLSDRGVRQKYLYLKDRPKEAKNFFESSIAYDRILRARVAENTLKITQGEGEAAARLMCDSWRKKLGYLIPCDGVFSRGFAVLKVPGVPTVLVEVGFMSNRRELRYLTNSYVQWKIARALYEGILSYFNLSPPSE